MSTDFTLEGYLRQAMSGSVFANVPLAKYTTLKVGGLANLVCECVTIGDLKAVMEGCDRFGFPWAVIGKGSNLIASDSGFGGVVIVLAGEFRKHALSSAGILTAGAGVQLAILVQEAFNNNFGGLEFASGIPGTLGGAISGNAGTGQCCVGDVVRSVTVCDGEGRLQEIDGASIEWGYRQTSLAQNVVIVGATLALKAVEPKSLRESMDGLLEHRKQKQPLNMPTAGSTFKNPPGLYAGRLLEEAGMSGFAVGGAQVSTKHANFIVNNGGATAADVYELMLTMRQRVREVHGIELEPEVKFLGFAQR